jgi:2-iminobutanoate/2-iminopropanoate deaminase
MKKATLIPLLLVSLAGLAQSGSSIVKFYNPSSVSKSFSTAAIIDLGNCKMVIISGQAALDSLGNLIGKGDLAKQTEQVFLNIKKIVTDLGGTMDNIVKTGIYLVDKSQIQGFRDTRNKFINLKNPPASTLVQVSSLFNDDLLIEIEATAIIPKM